MNTKLFRSSMHGYHRDDVNTYIVQENQRFLEIEAALKQQISDLQQELQSCKKAKDDMAALQEKLAQTEALLSAQMEVCESLKEELHAKEAALQETEQAPKKEESSESGELYEDMRSRLGGMMLDAHNQADEIVRRAKAQAQEILSQAESRADQTVRTATEQAKQSTDYIQLTVKKATMECVQAYASRMDELKREMEHILGDARYAASEAAQKTVAIIDAALADIDRSVQAPVKED